MCSCLGGAKHNETKRKEKSARQLNTLIGNFTYIGYKSMHILIIIIITERPLPVLTEKKNSTSYGENSACYTACFPEKSAK